MRRLAALALAVGLGGAAVAQVVTTPINVREPIEIEANALEVQQERNTATFIGNVNATQGAMKMRADRVVVAYAGAGQGNEIKSIDATGKVFLSTPTETAQGETANYDVGTGIITLTGGVVLTRGENVLRGDRLVLNLATGVSRVEGGVPGGDGRVRGIFVPNEGGAPK